jgi:short-subunit dehydrogenase
MHVAITGATSGLGWEIAKLYAGRGCSLLLSGRDEQRLDKISQICRDLGARVMVKTIDVTDVSAMDLWLTEAYGQEPIDLLVANAGIGGSDVFVSERAETAALARRIVEINTTGTVNTVAPLIPLMKERGCGHIVIIGSISAAIGLPQSPVYCASKAALRIYGDGIRRLLKPHGVRVTSVLPGFIDTPMSRSIGLPRPWCWSAERAALRIARDVERGAAHCIFPWQLRYLIGLQNLMPTAMSDLILQIGSGMVRDGKR